MSADEFDPMIERLFARSPAFADTPLFAAEVERKLAQGSRVRTFALTAAGLIGGLVAVREAVGGNVNFAGGQTDRTVQLVDRGVASVTGQAQSQLQSGIDVLGLGAGLDLWSMAGMQAFWMATALLIAAAALAAKKLTDQI